MKRSGLIYTSDGEEGTFTRRQLLRFGGLALGLTGAAVLLEACGGQAQAPTSASPSLAAASAPPAPPSPSVAAASAPPVPSVAPASSAAAASTAALPKAVVVSAKEDGASYLFDVDNLAVASGPVSVTFKNGGKMSHELFLYPTQDVSQMMTLNRAGKDANEPDFIKAIAGNTDEVDPGKSATFNATLSPGFYEFACYEKGKNPDGSTYVHFDKGQTVTIAAVGAGGPSPAILTPAKTMNVQLVPGAGAIASSWVIQPDRLVVSAGDVAFSVTNKMPDEHDFVVYPLGDISAFIADRMKGGEHYDMIKAQQLMEDLPQGQTGQKVAKLTPGMWAGACFMTSKNADGSDFLHRDKGQRFTFLVKA